jgi:hypothetical protein
MDGPLNRVGIELPDSVILFQLMDAGIRRKLHLHPYASTHPFLRMNIRLQAVGTHLATHLELPSNAGVHSTRHI